MIKISAVIITFNEEKNIERCIKSLDKIADDIVVVDSFSTDRTEEICRSLNVRFVQHTFEGHIEQKNLAITQARYPHVLSLDADEALSEKLQQSILEIKENFEQDGYYMNRLTNYCGQWIKHCGWYPDKKLRLWDSSKGQWAGMNPHDRFEMEAGASTGYLKGDILHYSCHTISDHIRQVNYFSDIAAEAAFKKGLSSSTLKIVASPIIKFMRDYFLKLGFLDGLYGLIICSISAHAKFLKYSKLKMLYSLQRSSK